MWFVACDLLMKNIFKKYMQINKRGMGIKASWGIRVQQSDVFNNIQRRF